MKILRIDKRFLTLFIIIFVQLVGFGIILPLLPYYSESLGASPLTIGFLLASFSLFQFIFSPILGEISDKIGRRPVLLISMLGTVISFILLGIANTMLLLFVSRIIDGISGGNISAAQAYIADITNEENRTYGMGILTAGFGLGFIFGPSIGGLLAQYGYHVPALFAAVLSFIAFILTYFFLPESLDKTKVPLKTRNKLFDIELFKDALSRPTIGALIILFFFFMLAFSLLQGTFALFANDSLGLSVTQVGYVFAYIGIVSVVTQLVFLKKLVKYFGEKKLAVVGLMIAAVSFALIPFAHSMLDLMFVFTTLSFGNSVVNPVLTGLISKLTPKHEQGSVMGIFQSVSALGRLFGPLAGTFVYEYSIVAPYFAASIVVGLSSFGAFNILRKIKNVHKIK